MKTLAHIILIVIPALFILSIVKVGVMLVRHFVSPETVAQWGMLPKLTITIGFVILGLFIVHLLLNLWGKWFYRARD